MAKVVVATPAAARGLRVRARTGHRPRRRSRRLPRATSRALDPQFARAVGARARARVLADYTWAPSLRLLDHLVTPVALRWRERRRSADG